MNYSAWILGDFLGIGIMMHRLYLVIFHNYFAPRVNPNLYVLTVLVIYTVVVTLCCMPIQLYGGEGVVVLWNICGYIPSTS